MKASPNFRVLLFIILNLASAGISLGSDLKTSFFEVSHGQLLRVGIQKPENNDPIEADVLYFHGYGDRIDNHAPLFNQWANSKFRVIAFDYPSHGESRAGSIDSYGFMDLASLALQVEAETREDLNRPLFLAGWSTGGLLAIRLVQTKMYSKMTRKPKGLILFAPGVSVYKLIGGDGIIRENTLTNNPFPPHRGPIKPISPFVTPVFATRLLANSLFSRYQNLPPQLPILTFVADKDEDLYVQSAKVKEWVIDQRFQGATVYGFYCPGSKHEVDNEPWPIGDRVRNIASAFVHLVLQDNEQKIRGWGQQSCHYF